METFVKNQELLLNPNEAWYHKDEIATVECIIGIMARALSTGMIKRLARLRKGASTCTSRDNESIAAHFQRFFSPAQSY